MNDTALFFLFFALPVFLLFTLGIWASIKQNRDSDTERLSRLDKINWCIGPLDRSTRKTCENPLAVQFSDPTVKLERRQHQYRIYNRHWKDLADMEFELSGIDLGRGHDAEFIISQHDALRDGKLADTLIKKHYAQRFRTYENIEHYLRNTLPPGPPKKITR